MAGLPRTEMRNCGAEMLLPASDRAWLAPYLDEREVVAILNAHRRGGAPEVISCHKRHVRYRPGTSCTILYDVVCQTGAAELSPDPLSIYARVLAPGRGSPPSASPTFGAGARHGFVLDGPLVAPDGNAVLREFPLDAVLTKIEILNDEEALARELVDCFRPAGKEPLWVSARFERLRYKPEVRLVLRCDLRWQDDEQTPVAEKTCQIRFEHGIDPVRALAQAKVLAERLPSDGLLTVPTPAMFVPDAGYAVLDWLSGDDLARRLKKGEPVAAVAAGRALAALHGLATDGLPSRSAVDSLATTQHQVTMLQNHQPTPELVAHVVKIMASLTARLPDMDSGMRGLVHGDFHQGQLLANDDKICVLDWDRVHLGDLAADYGNFLAQLELLDVRGKIEAGPLAKAFGEAHLAAGGICPAASRIVFWQGLGLVELALREVRRLRVGWQDRASSILARCDRILTGEGER